MQAECVLACNNRLGEGPVWSAAEGVLYWVDVPRPSMIHRWSERTDTLHSWTMPEMVLSLSIARTGGLLVASDRHLNRFDPDDESWTPLIEPEPDIPDNRINDGGTDKAGRFWFGTLQNNFAADNSDIPITRNSGSLYRYDPDGTLSRHDTGIGASNTVAWSPDDRTLYFADTVAGIIYAYDFDIDAGAVSNRRVFARNPDYGAPDGSTVDRDGYLWNCRLGAGCVIRFAPDGSIDRIVEVPTRMVTRCAFGGRDLGTLFITSARFYLSAEELSQAPLVLRAQPDAGGLFAFKPEGVRGLQEPAFGG